MKYTRNTNDFTFKTEFLLQQQQNMRQRYTATVQQRRQKQHLKNIIKIL